MEKLLNVKRMTGRKGIRKGVRVVEYVSLTGDTVWMPTENTVVVRYVDVSNAHTTSGKIFPKYDEWTVLPEGAVIETYYAGQRSVSTLPAGSVVLKVEAGCPAYAGTWAVKV